MHTFELSGMGKAPFIVVTQEQQLTHGVGFACEHCGRMIKHRFRIKSADNKVSVVGSDCVKNTGDAGLIAGLKRVKREFRSLQRERERVVMAKKREEQERAVNGGLSNHEIEVALVNKLGVLLQGWREKVIEWEFYDRLGQSNFANSMKDQALAAKPYTRGQLATIKEIITKNFSGARKNSKTYRAAYDDISRRVDVFQSALEETANKAAVQLERAERYRL